MPQLLTTVLFDCINLHSNGEGGDGKEIIYLWQLNNQFNNDTQHIDQQTKNELTKQQTREQVLEMGMAKYNDECRSIVQRYSKEWEATVVRMGRWIDFRNDYKTMEPW
jgi:hypothetical protein